MQKTAPVQHLFLCDALFLLCVAFYTLLIWQGIIEISADGLVLDSDLQTYSQGMAGEKHPELFIKDPVLHNASAANSIPNLQRLLATYLAPSDNWGAGLLSAGAIIIFVFYCAWYFLGRWLFISPALSALLSLLCGMTVWVGWGTFWGVTHSDPVPRVFFAAFFPLLLFLAIYAIDHAKIRPLAMLAAGCAIWLHGVSALNCGAMLFTAFALIKPKETKISSHLLNCAICLIAFFIPVLIFLYPSLKQPKNFTDSDLAIFKNLFDLRWQSDYSHFWPRLAAFFNPLNITFLLFSGGVAGWLITRKRGNAREKTFCKACPPFLLALLIVTLFCWMETHFAPDLGRLPMGHELVRGLRFLVPLSWVLIITGIGCFTGKWQRRALLIIVLFALLVFTTDRQYMAAQYALSNYTGLHLPLYSQAEQEKRDAIKYGQALAELQKIVPPGQPVFSDCDFMAIRFHSLRPLAHTFKDGYVHFYNKDLARSKQWLEYEQLKSSGSGGNIDAWLKSGAPWFFTNKAEDKPFLEKNGKIIMEKNGYILARAKQ